MEEQRGKSSSCLGGKRPNENIAWIRFWRKVQTINDRNILRVPLHQAHMDAERLLRVSSRHWGNRVELVRKCWFISKVDKLIKASRDRWKASVIRGIAVGWWLRCSNSTIFQNENPPTDMSVCRPAIFLLSEFNESAGSRELLDATRVCV